MLGGDDQELLSGLGDPASATRHPGAGSPRPTREPSRWTAGHVPGEVGIWVFILGDMLVFALFFGVLMVERGQHPAMFRAGRESLDTTLGAVNTLALLTGSILVVLAVRAARGGLHRQAPRFVLGAAATGLLFIADKAIEYGDKLHHGITPSTNAFYTLFFVFTGIHLLHLLVGMGGLAYLFRLTRRGRPTEHDLASIEICASYWHLVDLLWLVLFPLFYLVP